MFSCAASQPLQQATATHSLCRHAQSEVLHTQVVLSSAHVARYCPSGEKARLLTGPSWSVLSCSTSPDLHKGVQKSGCGTAAGLLLLSRRRRSGRYPVCLLLLLLPFRSACCLLQHLLHAVAADTADGQAHPTAEQHLMFTTRQRFPAATAARSSPSAMDRVVGSASACMLGPACPFFFQRFFTILRRLVLFRW